MKKAILLMVLVSSFGFSQLKGQVQISPLGTGIGIGVGKSVIPMLMKVGLEVQTYQSPTVTDKGTIDSVSYKGEYVYTGTNLGGYIAFSIPALNLVPIVKILANPVIHIGSIQGNISVDGTVSALGQNEIIADTTKVSGSYMRLGLPYYIGPVYLELSAGTQTYIIDGIGEFNLPDAQLAIGVSFF